MANLIVPYGPACRTDTFVDVTVFGHTIPFVRRGANALLRAAMDAYDVDYGVSRIESYNCRKTTGGTGQSAHSWAAAVDVNPSQNPFSSKAILITDMPADFRAAFKKHGFGWGGDWHSVKDAMHFSMDRGEQGEAIDQAFDANLQAQANDKWAGKPIAPAPPPKKPGTTAPPWEHEHPGNIENPHKGCETVRRWQEQMSAREWEIDVDGNYGDQSERVCRGFQREKGLDIDGILGPNTWKAAWEEPIT